MRSHIIYAAAIGNHAAIRIHRPYVTEGQRGILRLRWPLSLSNAREGRKIRYDAVLSAEKKAERFFWRTHK